MAHTPGPWERHGKWPTNIKDENGEMITTVWNRGDETEFNARLIAASPMLVALVDAVEWVRDIEGNFHCPWCYALKEIDHFEDCKRQQALAQIGDN